MTIEGDQGVVVLDHPLPWQDDDAVTLACFAPGSYVVNARSDAGHEGSVELVISNDGNTGDPIEVELR